MKHLRLFETEAVFEVAMTTIASPWVALTKDDEAVHYQDYVEPNTSLWYRIDSDNVLYVRGTQKEGYSERVLYTDITACKNGWYENRASITKAVIEEVIAPTSCARLFEGCNKMTEVEGMENLKMLHCESCFCMFNSCSSLTSLDLSNWNVSNVTSIRTVFQNCYALTSVGDLSNWNVSNVTDMSYMFTKCYVLSNVGDLSNWNTSNVTTMYGMFTQCYVLASVGDLSNWNTTNVTDMAHMFSKCYALTSVGDLSNWNTSNVTTMQSMFALCRNLQSLNVSNWDVRKVTNMRQMFAGCDKLTEIKGIGNWDVSNVEDIDHCFSACYLLQELDLSGWDLSGIKTDSISNFGNMVEIPNPPAGQLRRLVLGKGFFNAPCKEYVINGRIQDNWEKESIWESLYTNQLGRDVTDVKDIKFSYHVLGVLTEEEQQMIGNLGLNLIYW